MPRSLRRPGNTACPALVRHRPLAGSHHADASLQSEASWELEAWPPVSLSWPLSLGSYEKGRLFQYGPAHLSSPIRFSPW